MQTATLFSLSQQLKKGLVSSQHLVETAIEHHRSTSAVLISANENAALEHAKQIDLARAKGDQLPEFAGIPITVKDLFDISGEVTRAGSKVLSETAPAIKDATVIARLKKAGFILFGRANMSEFAFSGLGINPHYGTPDCIWKPHQHRIPGGSSSGSALSVAHHIVPASIGSDTAGSCRIPAAFNHLVGFKPTYGRLPLDGVFPLSPSLDTVGPIAHHVDCCYLLDAVLSGKALPPAPCNAFSPRDITLIIPQGKVTSDLEHEVASTFQQTLKQLASAGITLRDMEMPELDALIDLFTRFPIAAFEAQSAHQQLLATHSHRYDPFIRTRLTQHIMTSEEHQYVQKERKKLGFSIQEKLQGTHGLLYPTVAIRPPSISDLSTPEETRRINLQCLRNTSTVNYFDGCAISLPCKTTDNSPIGLMLASYAYQDAQLLRTAKTIENQLNPMSHNL